MNSLNLNKINIYHKIIQNTIIIYNACIIINVDIINRLIGACNLFWNKIACITHLV